jgi:hypothetical protein
MSDRDALIARMRWGSIGVRGNMASVGDFLRESTEKIVKSVGVFPIQPNS